jgi:hypothetical protein
MKENWNLKTHVYDSPVSVNDLMLSIEVFDYLKQKYPNDENVDIAIEILRDEICQMFGGTIFVDV